MLVCHRGRARGRRQRPHRRGARPRPRSDAGALPLNNLRRRAAAPSPSPAGGRRRSAPAVSPATPVDPGPPSAPRPNSTARRTLTSPRRCCDEMRLGEGEATDLPAIGVSATDLRRPQLRHAGQRDVHPAGRARPGARRLLPQLSTPPGSTIWSCSPPTMAATTFPSATATTPPATRSGSIRRSTPATWPSRSPRG